MNDTMHRNRCRFIGFAMCDDIVGVDESTAFTKQWIVSPKAPHRTTQTKCKNIGEVS